MSAPRWGHQVSLFQFRRPAFWAFAVLLASAGVLTALEQLTFATVAPAGLVLSWVLLAFYVVPVAVLVYRLDLFEREPLSLVAGAFLWGGLAATSLAGIANAGWGQVVLRAAGAEAGARWAPAVTAPFTEEILKAAGVVLIALIAPAEIDELLDGFVYGAFAGLGFAVVEDVYYFIAFFGGDPASVLAGFFVRVIAGGLYGHVLYSGLAGLGIAWFATRRGPSRPIVAGALVGVAVLAHFVWNAPVLDVLPDDADGALVLVLLPLAAAVKGLPFLAVLAICVRLAHDLERRGLRSAATTDAGSRWLAGENLSVLARPRLRRRFVRDVRRRGGRRAARVARRLHREQIALVLACTRIDDAGHPELAHRQERCRQLRDALPS